MTSKEFETPIYEGDTGKKIEDQVKIETVIPEYLETPNYDYGRSQEQLDYNVALRNKPTTSASQVPPVCGTFLKPS